MPVDYISLARQNREIALANRAQSRAMLAASSGSRVHLKAGHRNVIAIFTSTRSADQHAQFIG